MDTRGKYTDKMINDQITLVCLRYKETFNQNISNPGRNVSFCLVCVILYSQSWIHRSPLCPARAIRLVLQVWGRAGGQIQHSDIVIRLQCIHIYTFDHSNLFTIDYICRKSLTKIYYSWYSKIWSTHFRCSIHFNRLVSLLHISPLNIGKPKTSF